MDTKGTMARSWQNRNSSEHQ